ncbi:MAG: hypothetical protein MUC94_03835 [bacterium]|nr:hypothetical protein [bacterium]
MSTKPNHSLPDSFAVPFAKTIDDDIIPITGFRVRNNYPGKPMHPYFRDSYRIIRDLRRLVQIFDYRAVTGYESVGDLVDICQNLPEPKQTELISTVFAGAAVNYFSVETNKQLKKKKVNFLEWRAEKIIFRNRFKYFSFHFFQGWNVSGIGLYVPFIRTQFYRHSTAYYKTNGFVVFLSPKFAIDFTHYDRSTLVNPFFVSKIGTFSFAYDWTRHNVRSRFDLIKSSSIIIRVVHINYLKHLYPDQLLGEVILSW